jgi:hydrogenase maturation protease HycI
MIPMGSKADPISPLKSELSAVRSVAVLGVGNEMRGDDAVGLESARAIQAKAGGRYHVIIAGNAPENYLGALRAAKPSLVVIVDAADLGQAPGMIDVVPREGLAGGTFTTHGMPLAMLADYIASELKCRVLVVGVQPRSVALGEGLSAEAARAVERLAEAFAAASHP